MSYRAVEENLRAAMRCYARANKLGEARDYPGVSVAWCGMSCSIFNSALLNGPAREDDLRRVLTLAGTHFRQRGVGWTLWLCEDLLEEPVRKIVRRMMLDAGLDAIAQPPGMYAQQLQPEKYHVAGLHILPVEDDTTRLDFAHLSSVIFALPFHTAKAIYASVALWEGPMRGWVGYLNGQAVTLVSVVTGGGVTGVYSVGTLPEHQGHGCAETIMRHALREARAATGNDATVLQSTAAGLRLYTRMGYRPVTRFGVYIHEGWRRP